MKNKMDKDLTTLMELVDTLFPENNFREILKDSLPKNKAESADFHNRLFNLGYNQCLYEIRAIIDNK